MAATSTSPSELRDVVIAAARRLGFHRVGVIPVEAPRRHQAYLDWLDAGHHAGMSYLAAPGHVAARADLRQLAAGARTVVVVALAHGRGLSVSSDVGDADRAAIDVPRGLIARYARGADYHLVLKDKLAALAEAIAAAAGRPVAARPCADTAPLHERELAERAGLGFIAKNTLLIAPGLGSYVLLGELLLDVDIAETAATGADTPRCGRCRSCLDACPTGAFTDAYVLDARRCISYLTIENQGAIPRPLRTAIGAMIFGCDLCQEVCPFNAGREREPPAPELAAAPARSAPDLIALLGKNTNQLRQFVKRTALRRLGRAQLHRNVCIALGNSGDRRAIPALAARLADGPPLVRGHAAWALGCLGAAAELRAALAGETDASVRDELEQALAEATSSDAASSDPTARRPA